MKAAHCLYVRDDARIINVRNGLFSRVRRVDTPLSLLFQSYIGLSLASAHRSLIGIGVQIRGVRNIECHKLVDVTKGS